jgi:hypothetical protein
MTALKPMIDALGECLAENAATPRPPSIAEQMRQTGLHPIAGARPHPGAHAAPWTGTRAYTDAKWALECYPPTGRRVDRDAQGGPLAALPGGANALRPDQVHAAEWTMAAVDPWQYS